jgi:hypothetical protein
MISRWDSSRTASRAAKGRFGRATFLISSDYSRDQLYKIVPGSAPEVYREDSDGAHTNTIDHQAGLLLRVKIPAHDRTGRDRKIEVWAREVRRKRGDTSPECAHGRVYP